MKQKTQKIVAVLTVLLMVIFASQNFSQVREHIPASEYAKYVGNFK